MWQIEEVILQYALEKIFHEENCRAEALCIRPLCKTSNL